MSKICLEFLYNSFLYHLDLCEAQYRGFSDKDLLDEIERYREYVLDKFCDIQHEISKENEKNYHQRACLSSLFFIWIK